MVTKVSSPDRDAKPQTGSARWVWLIVGGIAVGFIGGFLAGGASSFQPSDPALSIARDANFALPLEQHAAFRDGIIPGEELQQAAQDWTDCVVDAGVQDFYLKFTPDGYETTHNSDGRDVEVCKVRHFQATYYVYTVQNR